MKDRYYILEYSFDANDAVYDDIVRFALIGIFSTRKEAVEAIKVLIQKEGFKDHPKKCFYIGSHYLNKLEWSEGFRTMIN
ncbi:hypothetical protein FACS1894182_08470 [Bacteroidia bacterium]|nr:hypothetical protein FACS1894182_08470 [Bacteroidia bacterium]